MMSPLRYNADRTRVSRQQQPSLNACEVIAVIYFFCDEPIPYSTRLHGHLGRLSPQFKQLVARRDTSGKLPLLSALTSRADVWCQYYSCCFFMYKYKGSECLYSFLFCLVAIWLNLSVLTMFIVLLILTFVIVMQYASHFFLICIITLIVITSIHGVQLIWSIREPILISSMCFYHSLKCVMW